MRSVSNIQHRPRRRLAAAGLVVAAAAACGQEAEQELIYQAVQVSTRDIVVSAEAAGVIEPDTLVEVKSKASGEILEILVDASPHYKAGPQMRVFARTEYRCG